MPGKRDVLVARDFLGAIPGDRDVLVAGNVLGVITVDVELSTLIDVPGPTTETPLSVTLSVNWPFALVKVPANGCPSFRSTRRRRTPSFLRHR